MTASSHRFQTSEMLRGVARPLALSGLLTRIEPLHLEILNTFLFPTTLFPAPFGLAHLRQLSELKRELQMKE